MCQKKIDMDQELNKKFFVAVQLKSVIFIHHYIQLYDGVWWWICFLYYWKKGLSGYTLVPMPISSNCIQEIIVAFTRTSWLKGIFFCSKHNTMFCNLRCWMWIKLQISVLKVEKHGVPFCFFFFHIMAILWQLCLPSWKMSVLNDNTLLLSKISVPLVIWNQLLRLL